jgi:hypothetical protein
VGYPATPRHLQTRCRAAQIAGFPANSGALAITSASWGLEDPHLFFNLMTQWHQYLTPMIGNLIPLAPRMFTQITGGLEILAGLIVRWGARPG